MTSDLKYWSFHGSKRYCSRSHSQILPIESSVNTKFDFQHCLASFRSRLTRWLLLKNLSVILILTMLDWHCHSKFLIKVQSRRIESNSFKIWCFALITHSLPSIFLTHSRSFFLTFGFGWMLVVMLGTLVWGVLFNVQAIFGLTKVQIWSQMLYGRHILNDGRSQATVIYLLFAEVLD